MKKLAYWLLAISVLVFGTLSAYLLTKNNYPSNSHSQTSVDMSHPPTRNELLKLTNEERSKASVQPLLLNPLLNESAQLKADEVSSTKINEHVGKTGKRGLTYIQDVGKNCSAVGENLTGSYSSAGAIYNWMTSTHGHREALLNKDYSEVGFGISQGDGYKYVVAHFCST